MRGYTQLTREERYQIYILKKENCSQTEIADLLGRDKSTISRELCRNRGLKGYRPRQAHNLAVARRLSKVRSRLGREVWQQVEALIRCGESALDLVRSNPALAYLVASNWVFHQPAVRQPLRSARALLRK